MRPSDATIAKVLKRLIRRLKANDTLLVAHRVQQSPPNWVFDHLVETNGVVDEAKHLVTLLKQPPPAPGTEREP